eukprot:scaffold770_cov109-Cylindrotheca_fusiformis.AAC.18
MSTLDMPKECLLERIQAMIVQEQTSYRYESCFPSNFSPEDVDYQHQLNVSWREKICQWSYNVVDHFDLPREVVAISLNIFDRYLATRGNSCSGTMALLASLTTLHIAIKIHSEKTVKLSTLASLSRGQFEAHHIEQLEWEIFKALDWKLHPPTMFAFISHFLMVFPPEVHHSVRKELFEVAIYMAELSVCDSTYVRYPSSTVAMAAILNVMEDLPYSRLSLAARQAFWDDVTRSTCFRESSKLHSARERLKSLFNSTVTSMNAVEENVTSSPTSTIDAMQVDETGSMCSSNGSMKYCGQNSCARNDRYRYSPSPNVRSTYSASSMQYSNPSAANRSVLSSSPIVAGSIF